MRLTYHIIIIRFTEIDTQTFSDEIANASHVQYVVNIQCKQNAGKSKIPETRNMFCVQICLLH
jgi:hypothetical protein